MRRRYEENRQKFKEYSRDFSKESNSSQVKPRENINIQIFNITSRNRNVMHIDQGKKITSTGRKPNFEHFDDSMHIEDKIKRGGSVFHRKLNSDKVNGVNTSAHGPIIPNYELKAKPSASHLNIYNKDEVISSEATPSVNIKDTAEEDIGVEELHFQKVRFQQKCRKLFKQ